MKTKFRKIVILLTAALLVSVLGACSNSSNGILKDSDYGDEFTNSEGFKDIKEDVTDFYNMTMKAYNESDKKHLSTFTVNEELFEAYYAFITYTVDNFSRDDLDERRTMVKAAYHSSLLYKSVAEKNLKIAAGIDEDEEWFETLKQELDDAYKDYTGKS